MIFYFTYLSKITRLVLILRNRNPGGDFQPTGSVLTMNNTNAGVIQMIQQIPGIIPAPPPPITDEYLLVHEFYITPEDLVYFPVYGIQQDWWAVTGENPFPQYTTEITLRSRELDQLNYKSVTDRHGIYETFHINHLQNFSGTTKSLRSTPGGYVHIEGFHFNQGEDNLTIQKIGELHLANDAPLLPTFIQQIHLQHPQGYSIGFQMKCSTIQKGLTDRLEELKVVSKMLYVTANDDMFRITELFDDWIRYLLDRDGDSKYEQFFINSFEEYNVTDFEAIIVPHNKEGGGCMDTCIPKPPGKLLPFIKLPKVRHNLCWFSCIIMAYPKIFEDIFPHEDSVTRLAIEMAWLNSSEEANCQTVAQEVGHPIGDPVFFDQMENYCFRLGINMEIYHYRKIEEEHWNKDIGLKHKFHIDYVGRSLKMLWIQKGKYGHFYLITNDDILDFKSCRSCYEWFNTSLQGAANHIAKCTKCTGCGNKMTSSHQCRAPRNKKFKVPKKPKDAPQSYDAETVLMYDLETFSPPGWENQIVYSVSMIPVSSMANYEQEDVTPVHCSFFIGVRAMEDFIDSLFAKYKRASLYAYNGSRFDSYFVFKQAIKKKYQIEMMKNDASGKIMKIVLKDPKTKKTLTFYDLCLYTLCSLKQACKDFLVPPKYVKKDFDFSKIKTWEDVKTHETEIYIYNSFDVISMGIVYLKFATRIFGLYGINIPDTLSLSHLAYQIYIKNFCNPETLQLMKLPERKEYDFLKQGTYGGRTFPGINEYESEFSKQDAYKYWDQLDEEIKKEIFNKWLPCSSNLKYFDVVSLYPSVCHKYAFPFGRYEWLPEKSFAVEMYHLNSPKKWKTPIYNSMIKRSFYEVDVTCPKDILIPFVLEKDDKGGLVSSLRDKVKQVYDGFTLKEAVKLGYRVTKIYNILRFSKLEKILFGFMDDLYKKKAASPKASVDYQINKYLMNGFTGKFSQHIIEEMLKFYYDDGFLSNAGNEKLAELLKMEIFETDGTVDAFMAKYKKTDAKPTKNTQLGVCILSLARVVMSKIARKLNAYKDPDNAIFYQDTDSYIIKQYTLDLVDPLVKNKMIGGELGKLKDEKPGCIITRLYAPAPKTYYLEYINAEDLKIYAVSRTKGCPQPSISLIEKTFIPGDIPISDIKASQKYNLSKVLEEHGKQSAKDLPRFDLRQIFYTLCTRQGLVLLEGLYLTREMFKSIVVDDNLVVVTFGRIDKKMIVGGTNKENYGVVKILFDCHRTVNKNNWWRTPLKRIMIDDGVSPYSIPHGHFLYDL